MNAVEAGADLPMEPALAAPLAAAAVLAAFVAGMLTLAGEPVAPPSMLALLGGALAVAIAGELILGWFGLAALPASLSLAIVLGAVSTSIVLFAVTALSGLPAGQVFVGWGAVVAAAAFLDRRRLAGVTVRQGGGDVLVLLLLAVVVGFWCRESATVLRDLALTGVLEAWPDAYIHGSVIAQFGDPLAAGRGTILFVGQPLVLYHYGFYMIAAAVAGLSDLPGLGLATAVLTPVGLLLAAAGAHGLATALAGRLAGAIAIGFLVLLPDASLYGLENGFYGVQWLLFTAPGSGYGMAAAAAALICALEWLRAGTRSALALALALAAATFLLRVHIFLWLVPALGLTLAAGTRLARRHRRPIAWAAAGLVGLILVLLETVRPLTRFWLTESAAAQLMFFSHTQQEPTAYTGFYKEMVTTLGRPVAILIGALLLVPATLGLFTLLYPAALFGWLRRASGRAIDLFPLLLTLVFLAFALFAPIALNDSTTEYQQRPIVLLYMVVAVFTAAYLARLIRRGRAERPGAAVVTLAAITAGSIGLGLATGYNPAEPHMGWGGRFYGETVEPGLVEAARYVRRLAGPRDTVAVAPAEPEVALYDRATRFVSLTDVPAVIGRAGVETKVPGARGAEARRRLRSLQEIETIVDPGEAFARIRQMGIAWYVVIGPAGPSFDPTRAAAEFVSGNVAVYLVAAP